MQKIQINIQITQAENGFVVIITGNGAQRHFIAQDITGAAKTVTDFCAALKDAKPNG